MNLNDNTFTAPCQPNQTLAPTRFLCYYHLMMNNLYYFDLILTDLQDMQTLRRAYDLMSEERKLRCKRLRLYEDKRACICADMLIRKLAKNVLGMSENEVVLCAEESGKPFIKGTDCHISISHSKNAVVCALSAHPIGVDIEKIATPPRRVVERLCPDTDNLEDFYRFWTAAESFGKLTGQGVWQGVKDVSFQNGTPLCSDPSCRFEALACPNGFVATICIKA